MELDTFADELVSIFKSAGWKIGEDVQLLSGLEKATGLGVVVNSQEQHPKVTAVLFRTLQSQGFKIDTAANPNVPPNEIRVVVAPKN